jgi:hypothetical protein
MNETNCKEIKKRPKHSQLNATLKPESRKPRGTVPENCCSQARWAYNRTPHMAYKTAICIQNNFSRVIIKGKSSKWQCWIFPSIKNSHVTATGPTVVSGHLNRKASGNARCRRVTERARVSVIREKLCCLAKQLYRKAHFGIFKKVDTATLK